MAEVRASPDPGDDIHDGLSVAEVQFELHEQSRSPVEEALEESIAQGQLKPDEMSVTMMDASVVKRQSIRKRLLIATPILIGALGIVIGILHSAGIFNESVLLHSMDHDSRSCLEVFSAADTDRDGFLVYEELRAFHKHVAKANKSHADRSIAAERSPGAPPSVHVNDPIVEYLLAADSDRSGTIDFGEYMAMGTAQALNMSDSDQDFGGNVARLPSDVRRLAERDESESGLDPAAADLEDRLLSQWDGGFDSDENQELNILELKALLEAQGEHSAHEEVEKTMQQYDEDLNGQLSMSELEKIHYRDEVAAAESDAGRDPGRLLAQEERACNGAASLCTKRFDEVAYATTHNSYNNNLAGYKYANQYETVLTQLNDGIRGFMMDFHVGISGGSVVLCHGGYTFGVFCPGGMEDAANMLRSMRVWLEAHPNEVITFIIELGPGGKSRPTQAQVEALFLGTGAGFREDGVRDMLYDPTQPLKAKDKEPGISPMSQGGATWPTLGEMIDANKRVVVLSSLPNLVSHSASEPWHLNMWRHTRYSPWSHKSRKASGISVQEDSVTCGDACSSSTVYHADGKLHILNHYITNPTSAQYAKMMNFEEVLATRAKHWKATHGRMPNFIAVDYYEIGNIFQVVDSLNGLTPRPWSCRRVGRADIRKRFCCPSGNWFTTCSVMGSCNKRTGKCSCTKGWEYGFDCSGRVCKYRSKCTKWRWYCWDWAPGCCGWKTYSWWC